MTAAEREKLIVDNMPVADSYSRAFKRRLRPGVDAENIGAEAYVALVRAADRWDPKVGLTFEQYAKQRIWGAMYDAFRAEMPWKRGAHKKETAEAKVRGEERATPPETLSLNHPLATEDEPFAEFADTIACEDPEACVRAREQLRQLKKVPRRDEFILLAEAFGYTQDEIGEHYGVTGSRISQLSLVAHLRYAEAVA